MGLSQAVGDSDAHHQQGIGKAFGCAQTGFSAGLRDERVLADGAGMEEKSRGTKNFLVAGQAQVPRCIRDRVDGALGKIIRCRKRFADADFAALGQDDAVGKSSADIDADDVF